MIVRSKELKNCIDNVAKFNGFLIYGADKGKVKENANNIIKKLQSDYGFGNVKVLNEDLEKNTLLDLIFQKDIFCILQQLFRKSLLLMAWKCTHATNAGTLHSTQSKRQVKYT